MIRIVLATSLAVTLGGCIVKTHEPEVFRGTYIGDITETYDCDNSGSYTFKVLDDQFDISQNGSAIDVTISSCSGLTIPGNVSVATASMSSTGNTSDLCQQDDGNGDQISVDDFNGGTLTVHNELSPPELDVDLKEDATINGDACSGHATGTLVLQ